jgi:iron complex outermembrane receptor protein
MDNRLYTYAYANSTLSGNTGTVVTGFTTATVPVNATTNPNGVLISATTKAGDVLGYDKRNQYRVWGYIGQITYEFGVGKLRAGGWYEEADTNRHLFDLDRTTGLISYNEKFNNGSGTAAANALPSTTLANIAYDQHSGWRQYQLFSELELRPIETLSITPGVKYMHFERSVDATVNQTSRNPINTQATWEKTLPFATANLQLAPNWSFYAQYAQGMYVPDLSSFYSPSGSANDQSTQALKLSELKPQNSTNFQIGTVWHSHAVSIDIDGYIINVDNKIATSTLATDPANTLVNIGQVRYRGAEGQISYVPVTGLTLYANASYNQARSVTTGAQIAKTPLYTAALGGFYTHNGFRISYTHKFAGASFAKEFDGNPNIRLYRIAPATVGDFAMSQEIGEHLRLGLTISNVFDRQAVTAIGTSSTGAPTTTIGGKSYQSGYGQSDAFSYMAPRSVMVDARVKF